MKENNEEFENLIKEVGNPVMFICAGLSAIEDQLKRIADALEKK